MEKRIQLSKFKLDGLSYYPQVRSYFKTHAKDFDDQKVGDGIDLTVMPIRFDLIFLIVFCKMMYCQISESDSLFNCFIQHE